jgi:hypothetical protein
MTTADRNAIGEVKRKLEEILRRLDELRLSQAGAYLSMAIDCVEQEESRFLENDAPTGAEDPCPSPDRDLPFGPDSAHRTSDK